MDQNTLVNIVSMLLFVMACLVFTVNIIVEVLKKIVPKIPTELVATVVSLAVTVTAFFAWASYAQFPVMWYHVPCAVILGLFVSYAAMFGFDKFKQALKRLKDYK